MHTRCRYRCRRAAPLPELLQSPPNRDCGTPAVPAPDADRSCAIAAWLRPDRPMEWMSGSRNSRRRVATDPAFAEAGRAIAGRSGRSAVRADRFPSDFSPRPDESPCRCRVRMRMRRRPSGSGIGGGHGLAQQLRGFHRGRMAQLVVGKPATANAAATGTHLIAGRSRPSQGRRPSDASISSNS